MMKTYQINITVQAHHLDDLQHVNNVQYLEWVQQISREHWQKLSRPEWDAHYIWVVRSHLITYQRPAVLGDVLTVSTHVKASRGAQSERHVLISTADTQTPVVTCKTNWVLLDAKTGRPARMPETMIKALA
jgi:acyl-CoA thioester hydrolase